MRERYFARILLVMACLSFVSLAVLLINLHKTRSHYDDDTPAAINTLIQSNHSIYEFTAALRKLRATLADGSSEDGDPRSQANEVRFQFEILWSFLQTFGIGNRLASNNHPEELSLSILDQNTRFLIDNEPLMQPGYFLTVQDIDQLLVQAELLDARIVELGRGYLFNAIERTDEFEQQIDRTINYIGLFIALLLVTGGLALDSLLHANRQTRRLLNDARTARAELADTVDELRSGKLEQKAKDSFIAAASHDLRQPLHALGIFLNNARNRVTPEGQAALSGAVSCTEDLNRLFNSMLDLSRLDSGFVKVEKEDFNLREMMKKLQRELIPKAEQYDITLETEFHGDSSMAHSDPVLVERIARNLIENAVAHSQATRIVLTYQCLPEGCAMSVSDNGRGIPASEHKAIFSEYYQLHNPERDRSKGLGLGLYIVKRLTSLLDVELDIESSGETGTLFRMTLPKCEHQPIPGESSGSTESSINCEALAGRVVVVIDDDEHIRQAMAMLLSSHDIVSVCAETCDDVLNELAERQLTPDAIVADYRLRDHLTGDAVIAQLRSAVEYDTPAIIISGDTSPARMSSLKNSGFDILHKPVETDALLEKLLEILERDCLLPIEAHSTW